MPTRANFFDRHAPDWRHRLSITVDVMRGLSRITDPREMYETYAHTMGELLPTCRRISLSRRDLTRPNVRVTRFNLWSEAHDPWRDPDKLPLIEGGLFADLLYAEQPRIINELDIDSDDPAAAFVEGQRSLMAIPLFDDGIAQNMVIVTREEPHGFTPDRFPDLVWMSNLFGRATQAAILSQRIETQRESEAHEMRRLARMQLSLLPAKLPDIPTLDLAVHYRTSSQAGGDYYDVLALPKGRWGILIADVSGHGASAAVLMAITHSLAKTYTGPSFPPGLLLAYLNRHLAVHFTSAFGAFVTAFYAIYDPDHASLTFANAGHNPPRLIRCRDGSRLALEGKQRLPLGISDREEYPEETIALVPGDQVIFYTDGISEAPNRAGEHFGIDRIDAALAGCPIGAQAMLNAVLESLEVFTAGAPATDDRTLLAAKFIRTDSRF